MIEQNSFELYGEMHNASGAWMMYGFKHEFSISHLKCASCFCVFCSVSD